MGKRPGMHHRGAPAGRAPDRRRIQQVVTIKAVITDDVVAQVLEMSCYRGTHVTAMPRDQNPHVPMIGGRLAAAPADSARESGRKSGIPPIAEDPAGCLRTAVCA